jgi:molecular chaperone DnaK
MVSEADRCASEDKKRREVVDARNAAEAQVYAAEKQLKELGDKVCGRVGVRARSAEGGWRCTVSVR